MPQHIQVVNYRSIWEEQYQQERQLLCAILGSQLLEIHHIGSTAVKGLPAKPIIDILPVVQDIEKVDQFNPQFEAVGYECLGEFGISGRRYLRKGGDDRTHQVHIFDPSHSLDIERHLAVRDYLRTHPDACQAYGRLKIRLAERFPFDIEGYCDGKDAFVKNLEQKALIWYRARHR